MALVLPPDRIIEEIHDTNTRVYSRLDIYESDGVTLWEADAPLISGTVNIDMERDERRTMTVELENVDLALRSQPGGFWYDKVLKPYRGVRHPLGDWEVQLGEFVLDQIDSSNFPHTVRANCRDYTKKCLTSKFTISTSFAMNTPIENVINTLALNAGVTKIDLPLTGDSLGRTYLFERNTERWKAMKEIATAYGWDLYFRPDGYLTMTEFKDPANPALSPSEYEFSTGPDGNLISFSKATSDARLYNHVVVSGENMQQAPVWAEARNTEPTSPTSIANLGYEKSYFYSSSFITTVPQAQQVADNFLAVRALEQFDVTLEAFVVPYLDVGIIADYDDPEGAPTDPTRFLVSALTIPLGLGTMSGTLRRVTVVG